MCYSTSFDFRLLGRFTLEIVVHFHLLNTNSKVNYVIVKVDLYANRQITHCPMWFMDRPKTLGQDVLASDWPDSHIYKDRCSHQSVLYF